MIAEDLGYAFYFIKRMHILQSWLATERCPAQLLISVFSRKISELL